MKKCVIGRDVKDKRIRMAVDDLSFRPSIYAVIIKNGKILLSPVWDGYDFPGGGIEKGETLDEALEREVKEETGLKAKRGEVIFVESDFFLAPYTKQKLHTILIYCTANVTGGKISAKYFDEHEKKYAKPAEWVDIKAVKKLKFYNAVDSVKIIRKALKIADQ